MRLQISSLLPTLLKKKIYCLKFLGGDFVTLTSKKKYQKEKAGIIGASIIPQQNAFTKIFLNK